MLALLKLIPWKDVFYGAIIVGLVGFIFHKGEARIEAADAKLAAHAAQIDAAVLKTAQTQETQSAIIYKQAVSIPAVADLGLVCHKASGGEVPAANPITAAPAGAEPADSGVGPAYDPSGPLLTRAREADAQISYLQRRVHELEAEMNGAP